MVISVECATFTGLQENQLMYIDTRKGKILNTIQFPIDINDIIFDVNGKSIFVATSSGKVLVVPYPGGTAPQYELEGHTGLCICLEVDRERKYMGSGGTDSIAALWDLSNMMCVRTFCALDGSIRSLAFSHDGNLIASGADDNVIDISHVETGKIVTQ